MNFFETINEVKQVVSAIETFGEPVKNILKSVSKIARQLKFDKVANAIDFILNTEPILLSFLLDSIKKVEEFSQVTGIKGSQKLEQALTFTNQKFRDVNYESLFDKAVGVINLFSGAEK